MVKAPGVLAQAWWGKAFSRIACCRAGGLGGDPGTDRCSQRRVSCVAKLNFNFAAGEHATSGGRNAPAHPVTQGQPLKTLFPSSAWLGPRGRAAKGGGREKGRGQSGVPAAPAAPGASPWDGTASPWGEGPLCCSPGGSELPGNVRSRTRPAALLQDRGAPRRSHLPGDAREKVWPRFSPARLSGKKEVIRSPRRVFSPPVPKAGHLAVPHSDALSCEKAGRFFSPFVAAATKALMWKHGRALFTSRQSLILAMKKQAVLHPYLWC